MQLKMSRSEKKGMFKTSYILNAHVILTSEEQSLIKRHKLGDFRFFDAEEEWGAPHIWRATADGYITKGPHDFKCETTGHLAVLEEKLQENCKRLSDQLKGLDGAFDNDARIVEF